LSTSSFPGTNVYVLSIFLYHVLQYGIVANRNFPLQSSSYEKGGGTIVSGTYVYASINTGSATNYNVAIPTSSYIVSPADTNRILALRSTVASKYNSGLFRILSSSISGNLLNIDYRVNSGTLPTPDNTLAWRIYEAETIVSQTWLTGSNGISTGYGSFDTGTSGSLTSSASRIILRSPDDSAWQVRLCLESGADVTSGSVPSGMSIAPGDYSLASPFETPRGNTLHGPLYHNTTSSLYNGSAVGLGPSMNGGNWSTGSVSITIVGNDVNGTCIIVNKGLNLLSSGWAAFGLPEDELGPPYNTETMERLFVVGSSNATSKLTWRSDFFNTNVMNGVCWSKAKFPIPCVMSCYADILNATSSFRNLPSSHTSSFGGFTELIDVELLAGSLDTVSSPTTSSIFRFEQRRFGRFPLARLGQVNYPIWSHSPDAAWLHAEDGIFIPWNGPVLSGSNTGSIVWVISGSNSDEEGLQSYMGNTPGSDPEVLVIPSAQNDVDATRYRKTYSYFRQPVVEATIIKGGSNPSRS
jgi:hypothetical protein